MTSTQGLFIPYKFHDNLDLKETEVFCRETKTSEFRKFTLGEHNWMIVDPFKYLLETEEEKVASLERTFKTTTVFYNSRDRYLIKNYNTSSYNEGDYKSVSFLPEVYPTKISMNQKRFYNLFTENGEWTSDRGHGYSDMQSYHILIKKTDDGNILYRRISEKKYQVLTKSLWVEIKNDVDIIFSTISRSHFKGEITTIENEKDYVYVSPKWLSGYDSIDSWYADNISNLYELSFLSSRNISDIVRIDSKKGWELITDDIMLSINMSLYESPKTNRFPRNYSSPGKYTKAYRYRLGEFLLRLMEGSTCKNTLEIWKTFCKLGKWNPIISNIFNYERLSPNSFVIPDSCIYIDNEYIITRAPLKYIDHYDQVDYIAVLSEGSYITFDLGKMKTIFKGSHPLCQPLFSAGKRCIENYMLLSAKNSDVNIEDISDLTDKTSESLKILTTITPNNLEKYQDILPLDLVNRVSQGELSSIEVPMWLGKSTGSVTTVYDPEICIKSSNVYLDSLMHSLDKIH